MPHHRVKPCRYRLRILNVSQFRSYNLHLSNGAPLIQIATDSGLMPRRSAAPKSSSARPSGSR